MKYKILCEECRGTGIFTEGLSNHCNSCKGNGYTEKDLVELDPDQSLPKNPFYKKWRFEDKGPANLRLESARIAFQEATDLMLKANYRKIKL